MDSWTDQSSPSRTDSQRQAAKRLVLGPERLVIGELEPVGRDELLDVPAGGGRRRYPGAERLVDVELHTPMHLLAEFFERGLAVDQFVA